MRNRPPYPKDADTVNTWLLAILLTLILVLAARNMSIEHGKAASMSEEQSVINQFSPNQ